MADHSDRNPGYMHMGHNTGSGPGTLRSLRSLRTLRRELAAVIAVIRTIPWLALLTGLVLPVRLTIPLAVIRIAHHDSFHQVTFKLHLPH